MKLNLKHEKTRKRIKHLHIARKDIQREEYSENKGWIKEERKNGKYQKDLKTNSDKLKTK